MNIKIKQLEGPNGPIELPIVTYYINPVQGVLVAGWNGPDNALRLDDGLGGGVANWMLLGRLSEAPFPLAPITRNSLKISGWDFLTYPNPLVAIGTYIGDEPPPMDDELLKTIADTVQQGARERELERSGDPGLMSEMAELIRDRTILPEGSFKEQAEHLAAQYVGEHAPHFPLDSASLALAAATGAYLDDTLQEADLLELADTDRERMLIYALIVANWATFYREESTRLDHEPAFIAPEMYAQAIVTQDQFDDYLTTLRNVSADQEL